MSLIVCQSCGLQMDKQEQTCPGCGTPVIKKSSTSIFTEIKEDNLRQGPLEEAATAEEVETTEEVKNELAKGLPDWNLEPPYIMVRRRKKQ